MTIGGAASSRSDPWSKLRAMGCLLTCAPETDLLLQGQPPKTVHLIERGLVKVTHMAPDGRELIVGIRGPNRIIGFSAAILNVPHATTATVLTKCEVHSISADFCRSLLQDDRDVAWQALQAQSWDGDEHLAQTIELKSYPARDRLERFLCEWICLHDQASKMQEGSIQVALKHFEIAALIAVTPQHLSRLTKALKKEGMVQNEGNHMTIPDRRMFLDRVFRRLRREQPGAEFLDRSFAWGRVPGRAVVAGQSRL